MNIMVLKRLLVTTLGALGMGALATGPASGQQVPAPDLFDDQVECSMHVPAGMADAALGMALGTVIEDGTAIGDDDADTDSDTPNTYTGGLANLNYIIPPGNSNCGGGGATADHDDDGGTPEVLVNTVSGAIAKDVAAGYSATLGAYLAVRTEDAAVKAANKALNDLLMDETDDDIQTATITAARETLAAAQTKQAAANAKLFSVGAGPINMLGIAEWRAKFAVEDAVTAWNTAVDALATEDAALNVGDVSYADYVPLRNSAEIDGLVDPAGVVNLANLRTYVNADGENVASQDAMTGVITGEGNFDAAGNLIIPMQDIDGETTGDQLGPTKSAQTYMTISDRLESVDTTVKALKKLQGDNKNALLQPAIDEAVRRAEVEQAHYQMQFNEMVADTTDLEEGTEGVQSIASKYAKYTAAKTARDNKGVELETAFQAREMATSAVAAAFTNPTNFYQQLVDRREYLQGQQEAEVTRLAGLTGDDAATEAQTKAAADAVTAAEKALTAATDAQASFQGLVAEGSPVKALVEELLKSDATGDDGGELVDAIAGAYEGQDANEARLDALLAETETETETMTPVVDADGNPVLNEDGTPMMETTTTTTTTESGRIPNIETRIDELFGSDDDEDMEGEDATAGLIEGLREDVTGNDARLDALLTETTTTTDTTDADGNPVLDADGNPVTETTTTESGRIVDIEGDVDLVDQLSAGNEARLDSLLTSTDTTDADGMTTTTESGRIVDIETSVEEGDAATLAAAGEAADAGDAATLAAAGEAADAGDATTLAAAGEAADAGDAATLAAAGEAADAGDATTLAAAGEAADAGDAATLAAAGEAADAGDATTLAAAGEAADAGDAATLAAAGEAADAGDAATLAAAGEAADAGDAAEATTRHAADMMLAGAIGDEATARAAADTAEATARTDADTAEAEARAAADTAEATARADADTALGGRIDTEASAREMADTALGGRIDTEASAREMADTALGGRIDTNLEMIGTNVTNIAANATNIMANTTAIGVERGRIDTNVMDIATNAGDIVTNAGNIMANEMNITSNTAAIGTNAGAIDVNATNITANGRNISGNTAMIGELSESLEVVRAGVAASMALAGMPHINGRGISIGVGSFDGEAAFAVGFQVQGETTSFKVGVTSSGGATGASAGVGFQF